MDNTVQSPAAQINFPPHVVAKAGWVKRANAHYEAAVRQHASGDVPSAYTENEIRLAELCLSMVHHAQS